MKQLIVVKPKTLSSKDKEKLTKNGHLVIEHPNPTDMVYKNFVESNLNYAICFTCGGRVYMTQEKLSAYKISGNPYYCMYGHATGFKIKK
jgi:hypothetical protein